MASVGPLIATVTLNPALDLTFEVDRLEAGESTRVRSVRRDAGGKGLNVSRAVQEYGGRTVACGLIGGAIGTVVAGFLADEGVASAFTHISGETRQNVIVLDRAGRADIRLSAPGPPVLAEEMDRLSKRVCSLPEQPAVLVLSGSLPPGVPLDAYPALAEEAQHNGIPAVLDADGDTLRAGLRSRPFLIKPNRHEASVVLGRPLATREDVIAGAAELRNFGVEWVAVTAGGGDVVLAGPGEVIVATPPEVEARSAVGAGDSFLGVLLLRLLEGSQPAEALRWAMAAGATSAAAPGTSIGHAHTAERLLDEVKVERSVRVAT
jgi:1-phosphofructokinase